MWCIYVQDVRNSCDNTHVQVERTKLTRKVLHYFAIFAIINELLIPTNCRIRPAYRQMQTRGDIRPSDRHYSVCKELLFTNGITCGGMVCNNNNCAVTAYFQMSLARLSYLAAYSHLAVDRTNSVILNNK